MIVPTNSARKVGEFSWLASDKFNFFFFFFGGGEKYEKSILVGDCSWMLMIVDQFNHFIYLYPFVANLFCFLVLHKG